MKRKNFTLVEIMIVVAIIGLLAAIAIPNFIQARNKARRDSCINNLRQIDGAKEQAAMALNLTETSTALTLADLVKPTDLANSYIKATPVCKAGGTYTVAAIGTNPSCDKSATLAHNL